MTRLARVALGGAALAGLVALARFRPAPSVRSPTDGRDPPLEDATKPGSPTARRIDPGAPEPPTGAVSPAAVDAANQQARAEDRGTNAAAFLFANFTGLASIAGLIVYAVVRVAYDAFYSRLGISPEAVGLTETMILGRAALYLFLFFSTAAAFGGLWVLFMHWQTTAYCGAPGSLRGRRAVTSFLLRARWFAVLVAVTVVALVAVFVPTFALGDDLRHAVATREIAFFCHDFCEIKALSPKEVDAIQGSASVYRYVGVPAWLLAVVPLALLAAFALAIALHVWSARRDAADVPRAALVASLGTLALLSLLGGLSAPHFARILDAVASLPDGSFVEEIPSAVTWATFGILLLALATCSVPAVAALVARDREIAADEVRRADGERARSWANAILHVRWLVLSFLLALPLVLGFFAPSVVLFLEAEGLGTSLAGLLLWLVLLGAAFVTLEAVATRRVDVDEAGMRIARAVVPLLALLASLAIVIAANRGEYLAAQAADGNRIYARGFNILSVRANVVCLQPQAEGGERVLPRRPFQHLGDSGGSLVLYDYFMDRRRETPRSFPLRVPAAGFVVQTANYDPNEPRRAQSPWNCKL